jgi:peptide/nickel transport system permease protein
MSETVSTAAREAEVKRHRKENFKATLRVFFGRGILSKVCFVILVAFILVAVIGPFLLSDPYSQSVLQKLSDPSQEHFLGTDQLGRDLLTRVVWGARISMVTGLLSAFWAALIGTALGLVAGYFQGIVGNIIMRITDALLSIPPLILTMVLSAVCGGSILSISLIIAVSSVPGYVRMIYSQVLSLRESDYVTASGLIGQNSFMILVKHLLPNCFATLIVMFTMSVGANVMIEAGLSYLGVGITAPTPAWGTMNSEGYMYLTICPRLALIPGICLMLLIISLSVVGDGLRDALDPKLRGKL